MSAPAPRRRPPQRPQAFRDAAGTSWSPAGGADQFTDDPDTFADAPLVTDDERHEPHGAAAAAPNPTPQPIEAAPRSPAGERDDSAPPANDTQDAAPPPNPQPGLQGHAPTPTHDLVAASDGDGDDDAQQPAAETDELDDTAVSAVPAPPRSAPAAQPGALEPRAGSWPAGPTTTARRRLAVVGIVLALVIVGLVMSLGSGSEPDAPTGAPAVSSQVTANDDPPRAGRAAHQAATSKPAQVTRVRVCRRPGGRCTTARTLAAQTTSVSVLVSGRHLSGHRVTVMLTSGAHRRRLADRRAHTNALSSASAVVHHSRTYRVLVRVDGRTRASAHFSVASAPPPRPAPTDASAPTPAAPVAPTPPPATPAATPPPAAAAPAPAAPPAPHSGGEFNP